MPRETRGRRSGGARNPEREIDMTRVVRKGKCEWPSVAAFGREMGMSAHYAKFYAGHSGGLADYNIKGVILDFESGARELKFGTLHPDRLGFLEAGCFS